MLGTFIIAIALLAVMLYLIVRPFIWAPRPTSADVAHEAIPAPDYATVAAAAAPAAATAAVTEVGTSDTQVTDGTDEATDVTAVQATESVVAEPAPAPAATASEPAGTDDVRLRVEALIAARKAELSTAKCPGCQTAVASHDAFCRSCGTKLN